MRVTNIQFTSANSSETLTLSYRDPASKGPYQVKAITGLDLDEVSQQFVGVGGSTGAKFFELVVPKRVIVVRMQLNPNFGGGASYSTLRDDLYRLMSSSRSGLVTMALKDGLETVAIVMGFISKIEASTFTNKPEVQFTLTCEDGMLRSPEPIMVDVSGLDPENFTIEDPYSTAPHGLCIYVKLNDSIPKFTITDETNDWKFEAQGPSNFAAGTELLICSDHTRKFFGKIILGVEVPSANIILPNDIWPMMFPGPTNFVLPNPGVELLHIDYYANYWAV